jgi:phage terminase large subunit
LASRAALSDAAATAPPPLEDIDAPIARKLVPLLANTMPDGVTPVRYKALHGGRGGMKSIFFAGLAVEEAFEFAPYRFVGIREVQKTLEQSVKATIEEMMKVYDVLHHFDCRHNFIRTPGNGLMIFQGMQEHNATSIKSLQSFRRAWVEEAQDFSTPSLDMLRPTIRSPGSQIWASWNPKNRPTEDASGKLVGDAVDLFFRGPHPPEDALIVEVNFSDNPFLNDVLKREHDYDRRQRTPEDYAHIWGGAYETRSNARVFSNWAVQAFETPTNATFRQGADFGFSIDPSVLVRMFVGRWSDNDPKSGIAIADEKGRDLFICNEAYRVGCDVDHTPALFAGTDTRDVSPEDRWKNPYGDAGIPDARQWQIIADSARPETISYLLRRGFRIKGARKGAGSVEEGVEFLKAFNIWIHPRCKHTVDEFTFYSFKIDKRTGLVLPVLEDKKNHVIDACRYAVEDIRKPRGFFS